MASFAEVSCEGRILAEVRAEDIGTEITPMVVTDDKYTYYYTGKHDHGDMPQLRSNEYDKLVQFLATAKEKCGEAISEEMQSRKSPKRQKTG